MSPAGGWSYLPYLPLNCVSISVRLYVLGWCLVRKSLEFPTDSVSWASQYTVVTLSKAIKSWYAPQNAAVVELLATCKTPFWSKSVGCLSWPNSWSFWDDGNGDNQCNDSSNDYFNVVIVVGTRSFGCSARRKIFSEDVSNKSLLYESLEENYFYCDQISLSKSIPRKCFNKKAIGSIEL